MNSNKFILILLLSIPLFAMSQLGAFKIRNDAAIQIGYNNYKYLSFGASVAPNNGAWAMEYYDEGLNFWIPWPNYNNGNYKFYLGNDGRVGIGMKAHATNTTGNISYSGVSSDLQLQVRGRACARSWHIWSDEKLKLNINDVQNTTSLLMKLKPKSYNYRTDFDYNGPDVPQSSEDEVKNNTIIAEKEQVNSSSEGLGPIDYGFIASDIKEVFPNLVTEVSSIDVDAVNYVGLIPILVKGFQDQQKQIDYLKSELENVKTIDNLANLPENIGIIAYLHQNEPNPFDINTTIKYNIESDFQNAKLVVSDFFGDVKTEQNISTTGEGSYLLQGSSLSAGTYYYSLIVNNVVVDTRIMFLIK